MVFTDLSVLKRECNKYVKGLTVHAQVPFTLFDVSYDELWLLKVENYSLAKSLLLPLHCLSLPLMYHNPSFSRKKNKKTVVYVDGLQELRWPEGQRLSHDDEPVFFS